MAGRWCLSISIKCTITGRVPPPRHMYIPARVFVDVRMEVSASMEAAVDEAAEDPEVRRKDMRSCVLSVRRYHAIATVLR